VQCHGIDARFPCHEPFALAEAPNLIVFDHAQQLVDAAHRRVLEWQPALALHVRDEGFGITRTHR